MREHSRSGDASSTSMTSKRSREQPGVSWRKEQQRAPRRRLLSGFPGCLAPEGIQIGAGPVPGRGCLDTLILKEPYDIFPLPAACFPGPQVYVKEDLVPARYLSFQLGLKGVPLAQNETIDGLLGGFYARCSSEQVVDLAIVVARFFGVPLCFVLSHET